MLDEAPFWRCTLRLLFLAGLFSSATCQSEDDSSLHFSNAQSGRAVWLVEESNLPWVGSYEYLSSLVAENTALLTVVDSSTGRTLGECTSQSHGSKWVRFQWALASDSMQCTVSPTNSSRVVFPPAQGPRTFSVRIQAGRGPACIRQMIVQNERPVGCPPHLARNSFSSLHLSCSCPYEVNSAETTDSVDPQFPIFELGTPSPSMETPAFTISPCATHKCQHNGTCVVTQEGQATCLCQQGFIGAQCEVDVCASVPCQNGGVCKANGAEATCQCKPGYSGILCESASCNPECSNGDCVVTNGTAHCKCRQGFIGINCNVVDVCLGDAACAMFGDAAKCVLEAQNYIMHSPSLVNASYDCRCPHPVNGEFVDCLELHLSSVATSSLTTAAPTHQPEILPNPGATAGMQPHPAGVHPSVVPEMFPHLGGGEPGLLPTKPTVAPTFAVTEGSTVSEVQPSRPTFGIHPVPQFPQTQFPFSGFPTATTTTQQQVVVTTTRAPEVEPHSATHPLSSTFVLPQTLQTTTQKMEEHQPTHVITTEEPEEEMTTQEETTAEEPMPTPSSTFGFIPHSFPTPAPMDMNHPSTGVRPIDFNPFHSLMSTSQQPPVVQTTTTTAAVETTTMEEDAPTTTEEATTHADYEEHEDSEEMVSTEVVQPSHPITQFILPTTEQTPEVPTTNEVFTDTTTTQSTLPFWMFSTQPPPRVIPQNPHETFGPTPGRHLPEEEPPVDGHEEVVPPVKETTAVPTDVHQQETGHADHQSSSAVSWIVAILALIVLGLLLLAAALFVLRYIKQSRKLHGKYNPAREEHALSAAYSMPMSHITKEERLI